MSKPLKFIDLFCGCGGFSKGLEMVGHKCLLGVDFNYDAIKTFQNNHPSANVFHGDISLLNKKKNWNILSVIIKLMWLLAALPVRAFRQSAGAMPKICEITYFYNLFALLNCLIPRLLFLKMSQVCWQKKTRQLSMRSLSHLKTWAIQWTLG